MNCEILALIDFLPLYLSEACIRRWWSSFIQEKRRQKNGFTVSIIGLSTIGLKPRLVVLLVRGGYKLKHL
jgi:hypothetical protein